MAELSAEQKTKIVAAAANRMVLVVALVCTGLGFGLGFTCGITIGTNLSPQWHDKDKRILLDSKGQMYKAVPVERKVEYPPKKSAETNPPTE